MTIEIHVPDIGTDEVEVTEILVNLGDSVTEEESLITVEGDKASMEVPAPVSGTVTEINIKVGDKVSTGSLIMHFASNLAEEEQAKTTESKTEQKAESKTSVSTELKQVHLPDIGEDEVEITEILVAVGDMVEQEQSLLTVEGDKASMEVPAPFAGRVKEIHIAVGNKVSTNSLVMLFEVETTRTVTKDESLETENSRTVTQSVKEESEVKVSFHSSSKKEITVPPLVTTQKQESEFVSNEAYIHASPMVRRIAREFGLNLEKIKGTGHKNRIQKEDVQDYVKAAVANAESADVNQNSGAGLGLIPWPKIDFSKFGEIETKPLSRIKKLSGANLARNWVMIPHVTQFDEVDITELEDFRKKQNAFEAKRNSGIKITPLVFVMKAVAKALEAFPSFNASLSDDGESLIVKKYINIGVAVDTPNGLVVPVFKSVNTKGIYELSAELVEISAKARAGKLMASDMQGGTFTISSLGGIGGTAFTPIVNAPEVAILGVSKSQMKPWWNGSEFIPRLHLPLSLSYDHRVVDGAEGARFISYLNECLSDIRRLVL